MMAMFFKKVRTDVLKNKVRFSTANFTTNDNEIGVWKQLLFGRLSAESD
jgi:hypothetical protein